MIQSAPENNTRRTAQTGTAHNHKKLAGSAFRSHSNLPSTRSHRPARVRKAQKKLGRKIKDLRKEKGLTQEELARKCGISTLKMERFERGEVNPSLSRMIRFAKVFGIQLAQLLEGIQ